MTINFYTRDKLGDSSHVKLTVTSKKSNVLSIDVFCDFWSIVAPLYPSKENFCSKVGYGSFLNGIETHGVIFDNRFNETEIKVLEKQFLKSKFVFELDPYKHTLVNLHIR